MQVQVSFEQHGGKLGQVVLICLQQHQSWGQKGSGGERLYFPSGQKSMLTVLRKCKQAVYSTPGRRHLHLLEELEGSVALLFHLGACSTV